MSTTHRDMISRTVACPNCGRAVPWVPESKWRPFCSERCRLIDLGEWFNEDHRLPESTGDGYVLPVSKEDGS